jgi:hypothetical protein
MPKPFLYAWPDPTFLDVGAGQQALAGRVWNVQAANAWSIQRASNRPGLRFEARPGDFVEGQTDRVRAELQCTTKEPASGADVWVSYAIRLSVSPSILSSSMVLGQFHQTEDAGDFSGYPPFELNLHDDGLYVYTASVAAASRPTSYSRTQRAGPVAFAQDEWHNVVARVRFGWISDAEVDVWVDGQAIYSGAGIDIGMNDAVGPYYKFGIYYSPASAEQTVVAEYRNFEIGTASLAGRVANPLRVW